MEFRISISPVGGSVICFEHERMRFWWVKTQLGSLGSIVVQCTSGFMIYETRDTVFYRDIQTPRREFKIQRAAEYFWQNAGYLESRWNTVSSFWSKQKLRNRNGEAKSSKSMLIKTAYPNLLDGCDFLCFVLTNYELEIMLQKLFASMNQEIQ